MNLLSQQPSIARTTRDAEPIWEDRPRAPANAPNVVLMLCDDLGFSDLGCYGSEVHTPSLDELAAGGLRFSSFHVTPLCSTTRAALLTGMNPHEAGVGYLAEIDQGFPGYRGRIAGTAVTAAELFRENGYATFAVGKWHLTPARDLSAAGDKSSWPLQRGFDRFYGFLNGVTNLHHPHLLHEDNHVVEIDAYDDDYFLNDDLTDRAIEMIRRLRTAGSAKPFFLYFAHGAVHAPLMAKAEDIQRYRRNYDVGWDVVREARFRRQIELGLFPASTVMADRNSEPGYAVLKWDSLGEREKDVYARYMETYAAMVDSVDQSVGRLRRALQELAIDENTIFVFLSDNGASREGGPRGNTEHFRTGVRVFNGEDPNSFERDYRRRGLIGSPRTMSHYPWGWAMVSNTPFRLYKGTTFAGGHQVPMILSWPQGITSRGEIRRQYGYVSDLLPTLMSLTGIRGSDRGDTRRMSGISLESVVERSDVPSPRTEQYYESRGHRAFYRSGWEAVTLHKTFADYSDDEWQLYHVADDVAQSVNLASEKQDMVLDLVAAWDRAAVTNQVYPLNDAPWKSAAAHERNPAIDSVTLSRDDHTLDPDQARLLVQNGSFHVTAHIAFSEGDAGILVAHGDQGGGYALFVESDELRLAYNDCGNMTTIRGGRLLPGTSFVGASFVLKGPGLVSITLTVEGKQTGRTRDDLPAFSVAVPWEGIDVGLDRRSPVSWELHEQYGTFPYSGVLDSVTIRRSTVGFGRRAEPSVDELEQAGRKYD
jgi:arylsulfatase